MKENVVKIIKVAFVPEDPDSTYNLHANQEYVIGGDKEKKDDLKEEDKDVKEEIKEEIKEKNEKAGNNKKKVEKKKDEVKIEKEEKSDPAENVIISIFKRN